jgi:hypothetical protein
MVQYKLKSRKGQVTPGMMLGVGTVLLLFLLITVFTINQQIKLHEQEDYINKRSECLKLANLINTIYISGPGTEIKTHTDYLITTFNTSQISVEDLSSVNETVQPQIAFLASEAGPTTYEFYRQVNESLPDADWYKTCFDDSYLGGPGCSWGDTEWMDSEITLTIHDLMNNLENYNTLYLEDATMNYDHYAEEYIRKLENWTNEGNALILSEHVLCTESSGSFSNESYRCSGGDRDDTWEIFDVELNQKFGTAWGFPNQANVVVNDTDESFDLVTGDQLSFEERSYLDGKNATGFKSVAKYLEGPTGWYCLFRYRDWSCLGDSINETAVAYWDYGEGKVFYFADFQVEYINIPDKEFSNVLVDLISVAYYLIYHPESNSDIVCHFSAFAPYQQITGDITIKNQDNFIIIEDDD